MAPGLIPGTPTSGMAAEDEIARQVVHQVLPGLEEMLNTLGKLQRVWNTPRNDIPAKIMSAAKEGTALGGYDPADWARWGQGLQKLELNLAEAFTVFLPDGSTEETTLQDLLLTRYVPADTK